MLTASSLCNSIGLIKLPVCGWHLMGILLLADSFNIHISVREKLWHTYGKPHGSYKKYKQDS